MSCYFFEHEGRAQLHWAAGMPGNSLTQHSIETVWPSGLRRWLKAPVRKGVGSNPTAVTFDYTGTPFSPQPSLDPLHRRQALRTHAENSSADSDRAQAQSFYTQRLLPATVPYHIQNDHFLHAVGLEYQVRDSIVVSISACHAEDPGSIPGRGNFCLAWLGASCPSKQICASECVGGGRVHAPPPPSPMVLAVGAAIYRHQGRHRATP